MVYIHCWGGRGRAGLTACCLLTLLHFAFAGSTTTTTTTTKNVHHETTAAAAAAADADATTTTTTTSSSTATSTPAALQTIFDIVQTGYESRLGSEHMPTALSRSPQTDSQRDFVARFYEEVREAARAADAY